MRSAPIAALSFLLVALGLVGSGCAADVSQIVVAISLDSESTPAAERVVVEIEREGEANEVVESDPDATFPLRLGVHHVGGEREIRVIARSFEGETITAESFARVVVKEGESGELAMVLTSACEVGHCIEGTTCSPERGGRCVTELRPSLPAFTE